MLSGLLRRQFNFTIQEKPKEEFHILLDHVRSVSRHEGHDVTQSESLDYLSQPDNNQEPHENQPSLEKYETMKLLLESKKQTGSTEDKDIDDDISDAEDGSLPLKSKKQIGSTGDKNIDGDISDTEDSSQVNTLSKRCNWLGIWSVTQWAW